MHKLIVRYSSFFIMGTSSGALFFANILAKKSLHEDSFYLWNFFITLIGVSFSFGFLGTEQLFLRLGKISGECYLIGRNMTFLLIVCSLLYSGSVYLYCHAYLADLGVAYNALCVSLCVCVTMLGYNWYRILSLFNLSQLLNNLWKGLLFLIAVFFLVDGTAVNVADFFAIVFALSAICVVISYLLYGRKLGIDHSANKFDKNVLMLGLGYSFSLLIVTAMAFSDRWLVGEMLGRAEFSSYVYMFSILIMPFSIMASFIGFKEVASLKNSYDPKVMKKKLIKTSLFISCSYSVWFFIVYKLKAIIFLDISLDYLFPTLLLVNLKACYAILSSLMGMAGDAIDILKANLYTAVVLIGACVFAINLTSISMLEVLSFLAFIWFARAVVFYLSIKHISAYDQI